jgi:hypothetical protein
VRICPRDEGTPSVSLPPSPLSFAGASIVNITRSPPDSSSNWVWRRGSCLAGKKKGSGKKRASKAKLTEEEKAALALSEEVAAKEAAMQQVGGSLLLHQLSLVSALPWYRKNGDGDGDVMMGR